MLFDFANVLVFMALGAGFVGVSLLIGSFLRPYNPQARKLSTYECGEPASGSAWVNFNMRFYIVALIFIIFEVEIAFVFPVAATFRPQREPWHEAASRLRMPEPDLTSRMESARKKLFAFRETRKHPDQDDKVLTDWNGLMIAALAKAAQVLDDPVCLGAATRAADFLLANLRTVEGRLLHR